MVLYLVAQPARPSRLAAPAPALGGPPGRPPGSGRRQRGSRRRPAHADHSRRDRRERGSLPGRVGDSACVRGVPGREPARARGTWGAGPDRPRAPRRGRPPHLDDLDPGRDRPADDAGHATRGSRAALRHRRDGTRGTQRDATAARCAERGRGDARDACSPTGARRPGRPRRRSACVRQRCQHPAHRVRPGEPTRAGRGADGVPDRPGGSDQLAAPRAGRGRGRRARLRADTALHVRVRDNGPGLSPGAEATDGHGLLGMRERAAMVGGGIRVESGTAGFLVEATLPLDRAGSP